MSHSHSINHDQTEPNAKAIWYAVIISTVLIVVTTIGSYLYFGGTLTVELNSKQQTGTHLELDRLRQYENEKLGSIGSAMRLTVKSYESR